MNNVKVTYISSIAQDPYEEFLNNIDSTLLAENYSKNFSVIQNIDTDITFEDPDYNLSDFTTYTTEEELLPTLIKNLEECDDSIIFIYNFDLSLDFIKENICSIANDNIDAYIYVNIVCKDLDFNRNFSIYLDSICANLTDENWIKAKEQIIDKCCNYDTKISEDNLNGKKVKIKGNKETKIKINSLYELANNLRNIFNNKNEETQSAQKKNIDYDEQSEYYECYTYRDPYNYLSVKNINDEIIIKNGYGDEISFNVKEIEFLLQALNNFLSD